MHSSLLLLSLLLLLLSLASAATPACLQAQPPALPDVWCRVVEYCCTDPICRDKLLQDEADVLQEMQDVGYSTGFMQLVCAEARARARARTAKLRTDVLQWHSAAFPRDLALSEDDLPPGW